MPTFATKAPLTLASGSAIRQKLLRDAGINAASLSVDVNENALRQDAQRHGLTSDETALALAKAKARCAAHAVPQDHLIIAADQILDCQGVIFSKPSSLEEAKKQLQTLRGQTHTLYSALVLWHRDQCLWQHVSAPHLTMRAFSDTFLDRYLSIEKDEILYCAGAYRLEGPGIQLFERYDGTYDAILGLPLTPLLAALRTHAGLLA